MNAQIDSLMKEAIAKYQQRDYADAESVVLRVLAGQSGNCEALHLMGVISVAQGRSAEAEKHFRRALEINPNSSLVHFNLAALLSESGNDSGAIPHHWAAITLSPENIDAWINFGKSLSNLNKYQDALSCFEYATDINPDHAEALGNQGASLFALDRYEEASQCFEKSLAINPSYAAFWWNRGRALDAMGRHGEAIVCHDRAIELEPDNADIWCAKGNSLNELKRYDEALTHYTHALRIDPERDYLLENIISTRMHLCEWEGVANQIPELAGRIFDGKNAATPFGVLNLMDEASLHRKTAEIYAKKFPHNPVLGEIPKRTHREKIRVGYFSHDFHEHATAFLTAELFELHDRTRFEIFAFSFGPDRDDAMRRRLVMAFDGFIDVRDRSDVEIAQLAREMDIDIAVDLQGYQTQHRTGIFACRAAPVQVNYLAYPGTMGSPCIDYLLADVVVIPPESRQHYTEKIAYLPHSYQANDSKRPIAEREFAREELGLPSEGFVFCCFNHQYKITPQIFTAWMQILLGVRGSVLWLFESSVLATNNLRREAERQGVSGERLIFAHTMRLPDHLARHRCADLFLDTLPYNAHTTASDALWAGLPVLTCMGNAFPARVAASLLTAMEMPELITQTTEEYVLRAIDLAMHPKKTQAIKEKLATNRMSSPLFNSRRFTRDLEAVYREMMERHFLGLSPENIIIK